MADRLATYDYAALGRQVRPMLEKDGRGWRACADEIGVTASDLSRLMAGQAVAAHKVFAVCDWAGLDPRGLYAGPQCFTGTALKQDCASRSQASPAGAAAGRQAADGGRSPAANGCDGRTR